MQSNDKRISAAKIGVIGERRLTHQLYWMISTLFIAVRTVCLDEFKPAKKLSLNHCTCGFSKNESIKNINDRKRFYSGVQQRDQSVSRTQFL